MQQLKAAPDRISLDSQPANQTKERGRLTKEQEVIRESLDCGHGPSFFRRSGSNHGALGQVFADELAGLGQDQVRLVEL